MAGKGGGKSLTGGSGNGPLPGKLYNSNTPNLSTGGKKVGGKGTALKIGGRTD
jgi:hypothetical protein